MELPQELLELYRSQIEDLQQQLTLDNSLESSWNDLGVQYKAIGDYEGAREVWTYTNNISPLNNVSFFNLGDLYHFYLKDFAKAEENFLKSKENDEQYIPVYRALYDLYSLSYKQETSAAEDILKEGLEKNPDNLDLLVLLAAHYKKEGRTDDARSAGADPRPEGYEHRRRRRRRSCAAI